MSSYLIALAIFLAWIFFAVFMHRFKKDFMKAHGMSLWGPFLMVRTEKGKRFIKKLSSREYFWRFFGNASIVIVIFFMISMFILLLWTATVVPSIPRDQAPTPQMLIGVPGVNPLIPLWYGIWGIAIAIVIHEFAHGILAFHGGMRLKSLGLVFMAVPMGAFVEPEEEDIKEAPRQKRMRVYAAGPATNILFSMACIAVFSMLFMGSITPVSNGAPLTYIIEDGPAYEAGLSKGDFITGFGDSNISSVSELRTLMNSTSAGDVVVLNSYSKASGSAEHTIQLGYWKSYDETYRTMEWYREENASFGIILENDTLALSYVIKDSPGETAGLQTGDIIVIVNGTSVSTPEDYFFSMEFLVPGVETTISVVRNGSTLEFSITPGAGKAFMGVVFSYMDLEALVSYLHRPARGMDGLDDAFARSMGFIAMPFQRIGPEDKLMPMEGVITDLYYLDGPMSFLPETVFWISANLLFWAFWISLMVGLTNALPAIPMDGGFIFHDMLTGIFSKPSRDEKKVEKAVDRTAVVLALTVFFLVIWQLVGPRL